MSSINLLLWQVFVFIQTLIFDESNGVFSTSFLNDSILVSPPRVFYVNTSNAGKFKTASVAIKLIFLSLLSSNTFLSVHMR